MSRKKVAEAQAKGLRMEHATKTIAHISRRGNRNQYPHRSPDGKRAGVVHPRPFARISPRGRRRSEFPDVHEPDDRQRDREAAGDREGFWGAADHGEALCQAVAGTRSARVLSEKSREGV